MCVYFSFHKLSVSYKRYLGTKLLFKYLHRVISQSTLVPSGNSTSIKDKRIKKKDKTKTIVRTYVEINEANYK